MNEKQTDYISAGIAIVIILGLIVGLSYIYQLSENDRADNAIEYEFDYAVAETFENNESIVVYYTISITDANTDVAAYDVMNKIDPIAVCATNNAKDVIEKTGPSITEEEINSAMAECETNRATVSVNTIIER